jgi:hypothetical protein
MSGRDTFNFSYSGTVGSSELTNEFHGTINGRLFTLLSALQLVATS